jgi:Lar family restriction alleviation protein
MVTSRGAADIRSAPGVAIDPCPFCGNSPWPIPQLGMKSLRAMWCEGCGADGPSRPTDAEAIVAWNERAPAAPAKP